MKRWGLAVGCDKDKFNDAQRECLKYNVFIRLTSYEPIPGAFVEPEYREFIPAIQLAVCLDRQGKYVEAARYNELASYYKPDSEAVKQNRIYFEGLK